MVIEFLFGGIESRVNLVVSQQSTVRIGVGSGVLSKQKDPSGLQAI